MFTKFDLAYKAVYNAKYIEFIRTLDAAEGVDTAHMVAAHGYAAFHAARQIGKCKCSGSGIWYVRTPERRLPNGSIVTWAEAVCFGCGGKGYQNDADQRRNWGYYSFYFNPSI